MLAYKAWRESEVRMLVTAGALLWFCALFVLFRSGVEQIYEGALRYLFLVFVLVLGLGGLLQERARGSAAFTLSCPVTRTRLIGVRALIGLAEVVALALVPAFVVTILSPVVHETFPAAEALRLSARWVAGGSVLFGASFFWSVVLAGPYSALASSMVTLFTYVLLVRIWPSPSAAGMCTAALVAASAWITERQDF
jgi:ABC-2 type transport system permease protein